MIRSSRERAPQPPRPLRSRARRFAESAIAMTVFHSTSEPPMHANTPVPMRVAAIQMTSGGNVDDNLRAAAPLVAAAAGDGAELVLLPENFGLIGLHATDK